VTHPYDTFQTLGEADEVSAVGAVGGGAGPGMGLRRLRGGRRRHVVIADHRIINIDVEKGRGEEADPVVVLDRLPDGDACEQTVSDRARMEYVGERGIHEIVVVVVVLVAILAGERHQILEYGTGIETDL